MLSNKHMSSVFWGGGFVCFFWLRMQFEEKKSAKGQSGKWKRSRRQDI